MTMSPRFKLSKRLVGFLILAIIVVATVLKMTIFSSSDRSANDRRLGKVTRGDLIQRVTIAGAIAPLRKTIVTAPYGGYVKKLFVKIGDKVKVGDPLVTLAQSLQSNEGLFPLRAQFPGTVVQVEKSEGEFVKEGDTKDFVLRIDDLESLFVLSQVPEVDRTKLKVGQEAIIQPVAVQSGSFRGIIRELSLAAKEREQYSRSQQIEFPVKIEVLDPNPTLYPGLSVILDIVTDKRTNVLTLPHEYIQKNGESTFVTLSNGKSVEVKTGLQNEDSFEILSGVAEGDSVKMVDFFEIRNL